MQNTFLTSEEVRTVVSLDAPAGLKNRSLINTQQFGQIVVSPLSAANAPSVYWARCLDSKTTAFATSPSKAVANFVIALGVAKIYRMARVAAAL